MPGRNITIQGIVTPCDWDSRSLVKAVTIATHQEQEYRVDRQGKGEELLEHVRQFVLVSGNVADGQHGVKVITVKKYRVINTFKKNNNDAKGEKQ